MARIGAVIASAQKGFKETVLERICAFLSTLDDGFGGSSLASRSPLQQLIPELPAQLRRK